MHNLVRQKLHRGYRVCLLDWFRFDPLGQAFRHCDEVSVLPRGAWQIDDKVHEDELEGVDRLVGAQYVVELLGPVTLTIVTHLHMSRDVPPHCWPPELLPDPCHRDVSSKMPSNGTLVELLEYLLDILLP